MGMRIFAPAAVSRVPDQPSPRRDVGPLPAARRDLGGLLLQLQRSHGNQHVQRLLEHGRPASGAGIPDQIRAVLERRSGVSMSGVHVHYDSPWPARLGALAYTQGDEIHIAPGQEAHLAHEAWHVVQQRRGQVRTTRNEAGVPLNDDLALEREADLARQATAAGAPAPARSLAGASPSGRQPGSAAPVQLTREHVHNRLTDYRNGKRPIDDADWKQLLDIFADWEEQQQEADKIKGQTGAGSLRDAARDSITDEVISALNASDDVLPEIRRQLIELWNTSAPRASKVKRRFTEKSTWLKDENYIEFRKQEDPGEDVGAAGSSEYMSWTPLSPKAVDYDPPGVPTGKEKRKKRGSDPGRKKKRKEPPAEEAGTPEKRRESRRFRSGQGVEEDVFVVGTPGEAALIIRSFTKQSRAIPSGYKFIWGLGMFEIRGYQDIIYTLLNGPVKGVMSRDGQVKNWEEILASIPKKYWNNPEAFFRSLQAVLRGEPTDDRALTLMAGAMICDVKYGINRWLELLGALQGELAHLEPGASIPKFFMNWYTYVKQRKPPGLKRRVTVSRFDQPTFFPD